MLPVAKSISWTVSIQASLTAFTFSGLWTFYSWTWKYSVLNFCLEISVNIPSCELGGDDSALHWSLCEYLVKYFL